MVNEYLCFDCHNVLENDVQDVVPVRCPVCSSVDLILHGWNNEPFVKEESPKKKMRKPPRKSPPKEQLVLFVVGPDMCGKTNIIQALTEDIKVKSFKASDEHESFLGDQKSFVHNLRYSDWRTYDLLRQTGYSVLFDRGYPCEWVYSKFFGRETDHVALARLDSHYGRLGAKVLVCTRKSFDGITDDLDPKLDKEALEKISRLYKDFVSWTACDTHTLFVDDEDLDREVNETRNWLKL